MLRYEILDYLNRIYPRAVEEIEIISVFYRTYRTKEIKRQLYYLFDKGYIEAMEIEIPYMHYEKKKLFKITPKGIDLLDRRIHDDSVPLPLEE
jgi:hypothetical protein